MMTQEVANSEQAAVDMVNNPPHYTQYPIQCIEVKRRLPASLADSFKYIWRMEDKSNTSEDLAKAKWYLNDAFTYGYTPISESLGDELLRKISTLHFVMDEFRFSALALIIDAAKGDLSAVDLLKEMFDLSN